MIFASFDQRIDPAAVLRTIDGRRARRARAPRDAPRRSRPTRRSAASSAQATEGRWLAFVPEAPLPADTAIAVTVGPGTPSAEGPRTTAKPQAWSFRTYGPLQVVEHRCGWNGQCPPVTPWQIQFSNPLDAAAFRKRDGARRARACRA